MPGCLPDPGFSLHDSVRILDFSGVRTFLSQPRNPVAADVSPRHLLRSERRLAPSHVGGYEVKRGGGFHACAEILAVGWAKVTESVRQDAWRAIEEIIAAAREMLRRW